MKRFLIILAIIVVLGGGIFAFGRYRQQQAQVEAFENLQTEVVTRGPLVATVGATGIVRSNQSAVLIWSTSGTVDSVSVLPGDTVEADQPLATIRQTTLPQNVILAQADLVNAQKALDDLQNTPLQAAQAQKAVEDAQRALDDALNPELQQATALQAITDAEKAVETAERQLNIVTTQADKASIDAQKAQVILAENALDRAQDQFDPYADKPEDNLIRANFQANLSAAQQNYDAAVRRLNALLSTGDALDIAVAEANLETFRAQLLQAQRDYERIKDGPSEAQVALLQAQLSDAQERYTEILDGPDSDDLAAAQARVAAAQATLNSSFITAPFDGVLSEIVVKPGDQVSPGSVAFKLDDLSRLFVEVEVSEVDINRVQVGQDVELFFDAVIAKEYKGKVTEVALVGTTVQGVVSFKVTVELLDADADVRPGMTAGVNLVVSKLDNVLVVPNRAVRVLEGDRVVYILDAENGPPVSISVSLGSSSDAYSEVVSGDLAEGDTIVLNPPSDFSSFFQGGPPGR